MRFYGKLIADYALRHYDKRTFSITADHFIEVPDRREPVELLNVEYPTVKTRRPDFVVQLADERILHLEFSERQ